MTPGELQRMARAITRSVAIGGEGDPEGITNERERLCEFAEQHDLGHQDFATLLRIHAGEECKPPT